MLQYLVSQGTFTLDSHYVVQDRTYYVEVGGYPFARSVACTTPGYCILMSRDRQNVIYTPVTPPNLEDYQGSLVQYRRWGWFITYSMGDVSGCGMAQITPHEVLSVTGIVVAGLMVYGWVCG
jgi:hypothetical protein